MINQNTLLAAALTASLGSAASAQLAYSGINEENAARYFGLLLASGNPQVFDSITVADGFGLLGSSSQTFNLFPPYDLAVFPLVNNLTGSANITTVASNTEYRLDWDFNIAGEFAQPIPDGAIASFGSSVQIRHDILLTAGQQYEMSWSGMGMSEYFTDFGTNLSFLDIEITTARGSINDLAFGFNSPGVIITTPFSFLFTANADEVLSINLRAEISVGVEPDLFVGSAFANQSNSFSIVAVPAPASLAILACAGLAGNRRRRA